MNRLLATTMCSFLVIGMTASTALARRNQPQPLPRQLSSADGDSIQVSGMPSRGHGPVQLCLQTRAGMWKKDIQVQGAGTLRSENGTTDCLQVQPGLVRMQLIKAKFGGVMTGVGYSSLDLRGWDNGRVTIYWARD